MIKEEIKTGILMRKQLRQLHIKTYGNQSKSYM